MKLHTIQDVAEYQLCCGCGACAYLSPDEIRMADVPAHGRRPLAKNDALTSRSADAMTACPGIQLQHTYNPASPGLIPELAAGWGPALEVWEGHAIDVDIRFAGSSGGVATALAAFAVEQGGMHGILHIAARDDIPYLNETVLSNSREQLLARTGSRYAPASPCDRLSMIEDAPGPCLFIGKPCDVAGANMAAELRPGLKRNLGLTIGIFCAGTPSTAGTIEMLRKMGIDDPSSLASLRYRGNGWPGNAVATTADGRYSELTYAQSWGDVLTKHVQWRCRICPDHTGEFADIAVGDPWHNPPVDKEPGRSLIVVRTERGQRFLLAALAAGYIVAQRADPGVVPAAQPNLLRVRGSVWGRLLACRIMRVPVPRFRGMRMFTWWWSVLTPLEKLQSIGGTIRRVFKRGLGQRADLQSSERPQSPAGARWAATAHETNNEGVGGQQR